MKRYSDRAAAGRVLASRLQAYAGRHDVVVLALPRGGVPVGYEVARVLDAPLDVFIVRKLGLPGQEELAIGALASGGVRVVNADVVGPLGITQETIEIVAEREKRELERREHLYRDDGGPVPLEGRTVILVDDGLATGSTMRAATRAVRQHRPARIVVAVPVAAADACDAFRSEVDDTVCVSTPEPFYAVGAWYDHFAQVEDAVVRALLARARHGWGVPGKERHEV
jgi:putative phosphoribosyl transferase